MSNSVLGLDQNGQSSSPPHFIYPSYRAHLSTPLSLSLTHSPLSLTHLLPTCASTCIAYNCPEAKLEKLPLPDTLLIL